MKKKDVISFTISFIVVLLVCISVFSMLNKKSIPVSALPYDKDYPVYSGNNVYEYYRENMLSNSEKILYDEIKESYLQFKSKFTTSVDKLTSEQLFDVYSAVIMDHPEMFWTKSYSFTKHWFNEYVNTSYNIVLEYSFNEEESKSIKEEIEPKYDEIVQKAKEFDTDYEKIFYVHDRLIETSKYTKYTEAEKDRFQSIVSIFESGESVCAGYSYGFKFIMDQLGIKAITIRYISDDVTKSHNWNMVDINGKWTNLDITWDRLSDKEGISYIYFLKNNEEFYKDHEFQEGFPKE